MEHDNNIRFIAKHYRKGLFQTNAALKRIKPSSSFPARLRIAAIVGAVVVLGATASILIRNHRAANMNMPVENTQPLPTAPENISRVIDFENAPLPEVVSKIKEVYGVELTDLPENPGQYTLSLHYEGNASDLVETINITLDTQIRIGK